MNSAVITKVEYRLPDDEDFSSLDIVPYSGKINEEASRTYSGIGYSLKADFLIAGMSIEQNELINGLNRRKALFRLTDADDLVYLVGTETLPARMLATLDLGGAAGAFKGHRCTINYNSAKGCVVTNNV